MMKQDGENGLLQVLLKEYELTYNHIDNIDSRLFQFIAVAIAVLGFIIGYMVTQRPDFSKLDSVLVGSWLIGAWLVPSFCLIMYSILIFQGYLILGATFNARILSLRINNIVKESALQNYEPKTVHARFFSTKTGSPRLSTLYIVLFSSVAVLYPAIASLAFSIIYQNQGLLAAILFVLLYASLGCLLLFAASGLINELPQSYAEFLKSFDGSQKIPYFTKPLNSVTRVTQDIFALILPRPADLFTKGPFFIYGFIIAIIITGLTSGNLRLLGTLFREVSVSWQSIGALCLIYFVVEEILLQQAKLIWDDIRDYERDKNLLHNQRRAIASGRMSIFSAKLQLGIRLLAALILGSLLGGFALLSVFLFICLHQIIYVLWAKPRSARNSNSKREQRELLFFLSFNTSLRFLAGVVSVAGLNWALSPYILFYVLCYFCSFGALAAFWKMEAQHYEKEREQFRSQSHYYLSNGHFWQYVGLLAAVLVGICMIIFQVLALSCDPIISNFYSQCILKNGVLHYVDYSVSGMLLVLILITLFGVISYGLVWRFRPLGNTIAKLVEKAKSILVPLSLIGTVVVLFLLPPFVHWNSVFTLFLGFFFLNVGYFFMYEGMTYEQYTNANFWKQLPNIKKAVGYFLFVPDKNIGLRRLVIIATSDIDPDTWENKKVSPSSSTTSKISP